MFSKQCLLRGLGLPLLLLLDQQSRFALFCDGKVHQPKMLASLVPNTTRRHLLLGGKEHDDLEPPPLSAENVVLVERCSETSPISFALSAGDGKGLIGIVNQPNAQVSLSIDNKSGTANVDLEEQKVENIFSPINDNRDDGTVAYRFTYTNVPSGGTQATVTCAEAVDVIISYRDQSGFKLEYEVTTSKIPQESSSHAEDPDAAPVDSSSFPTESSSGISKAPPPALLVGRSHIVLKNVAKASAPLNAKVIGKNNDEKSNVVNIHNESDTGLQFDVHNFEGDVVVLTQVAIDHPRSGKRLYRTIMTKAELPPPDVVDMDVKSSFVDDLGDFNLVFDGIPFTEQNLDVVLVKSRITLQVREQKMEDYPIELQAMLSEDMPTLKLHGGWFRKILAEAGETGALASCPGAGCVKVILTDAVALDPDDSYRVIAQLKGQRILKISENNKSGGGLSDPPSDEEKKTTKEMTRGRAPPDHVGKRQLRRLSSSTSKKLLVHGYCTSTNPFPINEFSNALAFQDPNTTTTRHRGLGEQSGQQNNWSNDLFARKIDSFAENNGIFGCGIVAHSQGGLASLHLYTYYWSCLDYGEPKTRMIQSVGSPYQGTALAGNLATLGSIFGAGCGTNSDLTESGAVAWLSNIPSWARGEVNYFTTSFEDKFLSYDYCSLATDSFLSDPEDGVIEKSRGQLSGAINRGHKVGWCHSRDMREPAQCKDSSRNSEMNSTMY